MGLWNHSYHQGDIPQGESPVFPFFFFLLLPTTLTVPFYRNPTKNKDLENLGKYNSFRQLWLVLGGKLMEINSNLFSRELLGIFGKKRVHLEKIRQSVGYFWVVLENSLVSLSLGMIMNPVSMVYIYVSDCYSMVAIDYKASYWQQVLPLPTLDHSNCSNDLDLLKDAGSRSIPYSPNSEIYTALRILEPTMEGFEPVQQG